MADMIQYPFALDENKNLVHIDDVDRETRREHQYYCPNCGRKMEPRQGEHNAWHFAHSNHKCGLESYIHKTAKLIIANRFNNSDKPFFIQFGIEPICKRFESCPDFDPIFCRLLDYVQKRDFDLKQYYTLPAQIESWSPSSDGPYRPDVLLKSPDLQRRDIFVEIHYKHKSTKQKLASGNPILEIHVRGIEDLKKLEERTIFSENDSDVSMSGFKPVRLSPDDILKDTREKISNGPVHDYLLPKCLHSEAYRRHTYHLQRYTLDIRGRESLDGIYECEVDNHDESTVLDITFDSDKLSHSLDYKAIVAKKYRPYRTCDFCRHCITLYGFDAAWGDKEVKCIKGENGTTADGSFDEMRGGSCRLFEWNNTDQAFEMSSRAEPIEGVDYIVWMNPKIISSNI